MQHLPAFIALSALMICTPGPDTALTIRNSMLGGRRAGAFTALGVGCGQLIWTIATSVGLIGVLLASERAFDLLKLAGAAYLIYLGIHCLRGALTGARPAHSGQETPRTRTSGYRVRQGLINDLANPKTAAVFASLLPQFVSASAPAAWQLLALGAIVSTMTFMWLSFYAALVDRFGAFLRGRRVQKAIDATAGVVLVGFGIRIATSSSL